MHNDECIMSAIFAVFSPFLGLWLFGGDSEVVRRWFEGGSKNA